MLRTPALPRQHLRRHCRRRCNRTCEQSSRYPLRGAPGAETRRPDRARHPEPIQPRTRASRRGLGRGVSAPPSRWPLTCAWFAGSISGPFAPWARAAGAGFCRRAPSRAARSRRPRCPLRCSSTPVDSSSVWDACITAWLPGDRVGCWLAPLGRCSRSSPASRPQNPPQPLAHAPGQQQRECDRQRLDQPVQMPSLADQGRHQPRDLRGENGWTKNHGQRAHARLRASPQPTEFAPERQPLPQSGTEPHGALMPDDGLGHFAAGPRRCSTVPIARPIRGLRQNHRLPLATLAAPRNCCPQYEESHIAGLGA